MRAGSDTLTPAEVVARTRAGTARASVIANTVGGLVVFQLVGFILPLFVDPEERDRIGLINIGVVAVGLGLALYLALRLTRPVVSSTRAWLAAGADPADPRHRRALRTPLYSAELTGMSWAGGAVILGVFNGFVSEPKVGLAIGITILFGGLTTAALLYLMTERAARPLTAAALRGGLPARPVTPGVRTRLVVAWMLATGVPLLGIVALAVGGWVGSRATIEELSQSVLVLAGTGVVVGLAATLAVARSISEPVAQVRHALGRVEAGDFGAQVAVDDGSEVGLLEAGFNRMAGGLRERERLRDLFGRHVGRDVAQRALEAEPQLGGEVREVAALFVDLTGSTTLAAERPPEEVVALLNRFFAVVVEEVEAHTGLVNKFEGDAALAIFGAPVAIDDPAGAALSASRAIARRLQREVSEVDAGVGVSAGEAVAGNVGALERFEYTVIGDPINEAARLCDLAKSHETRILASEAAVNRASNEERARWDLGDSVLLRGRTAETRLATPSI